MNKKGRARHGAAPSGKTDTTTVLRPADPHLGGAGPGRRHHEKVAQNLGMGMKLGSTCGAVTGGLIALGLKGADDETVAEYMRIMRERQWWQQPELSRPPQTQPVGAGPSG